MIKKIITLVLVLSMLPMTFVSTYAEDSKVSSAASEACDVLSALGYINSDYTEDMIADIGEFTRAEFAVMAHKVFGNDMNSKEVYYHDVPATHFAAESIAALVEMNILSVGSEKLFRPDDAITRTEAAKILLFALGYEPMVQIRGSWTTGIDLMANDIKLYKNVKSSGSITYADMLVMFYNALTSEILEMDEIKNGTPVYKSKGGTYLSAYRDIYLGRGVVTGADGVSIYGDTVRLDKIQIDDIELELNGINADEFLGREVEYIYSFDEKKEKLIWIKARKEDDILSLNKYENRPKFSSSGDVLTYYTQDNRKRTVKVSKNLNLIFNGSYVTTGMNEILASDFYEVRLVDSSNSGSYDVAIISDYENYRIVSIPDERTVYLECCDTKIPNRKIDIDSYEKITFITPDGSGINLSEISFDSIISVFESKDNDVIKLVVSSDTIKGKINSVSDEDDYTVYSINDIDYVFYKTDMKSDCKINDEAVLFLDFAGRIAKVNDGRKANKFAYLISARYKEKTDELNIKMYTKETGVKKFVAKDKIKIDGVRYKDMKLAYGVLGEDALKPQVAAYELDDEGNIIMLDLPTSVTDKTKKTSDNMLVKIEEGSKLYDNLSKRLGHKTIMNSDSVIFGVPSNVQTADNKEYAVASVSNLEFERTYEYISYSYTLDDEYFFTDVLELKANLGVAYWVSTRFAVDKVNVGLNEDDELVYFAEGYHGSEKKKIKLRTTCKPNPEELHPGDVISVESRIGDEVIAYTVSYCPHTDPHTHVATNTGYSTGSWFDIIGYVYDIKDQVVKISYDDPSDWQQMVSLQNSKILLYDSNDRKARFSEIAPEEIITYKVAGSGCDKVYVYINSSQMRNFVVFR